MAARITAHAWARMERYGIPEPLVRETLAEPDHLLDGHGGRKIAQKALNGYVLRVIYEVEDERRVVVTVYRARRHRYEV